MNIFLIVLYLVSMISSLVVLFLDFKMSKKVLSRGGEFSSKINCLNISVQNNKKNIVELESKVNTLENLLKSLDVRVKELEEKNNKNPKTNSKKDKVSKKPIQKKVLLRKVYNNNDKSDSTSEPQVESSNTPLEMV